MTNSANSKNPNNPKNTTFSSQIVREVFIPVLEQEVNTGKNFAPLRQIYHAVILSYWYKNKLKESLLNQAYADRQKVKGIDRSTPQQTQAIYEAYVDTFRKGVCNMMKVEYDPYARKNIPRRYFAGGARIQVGSSNIRIKEKAKMIWSELVEMASKLKKFFQNFHTLHVRFDNVDVPHSAEEGSGVAEDIPRPDISQQNPQAYQINFEDLVAKAKTVMILENQRHPSDPAKYQINGLNLLEQAEQAPNLTSAQRQRIENLRTIFEVAIDSPRVSFGETYFYEGLIEEFINLLERGEDMSAVVLAERTMRTQESLVLLMNRLSEILSQRAEDWRQGRPLSGIDPNTVTTFLLYISDSKKFAESQGIIDGFISNIENIISREEIAAREEKTKKAFGGIGQAIQRLATDIHKALSEDDLPRLQEILKSKTQMLVRFQDKEFIQESSYQLDALNDLFFKADQSDSVYRQRIVDLIILASPFDMDLAIIYLEEALDEFNRQNLNNQEPAMTLENLLDRRIIAQQYYQQENNVWVWGGFENYADGIKGALAKRSSSNLENKKENNRPRSAGFIEPIVSAQEQEERAEFAMDIFSHLIQSDSPDIRSVLEKALQEVGIDVRPEDLLEKLTANYFYGAGAYKDVIRFHFNSDLNKKFVVKLSRGKESLYQKGERELHEGLSRSSPRQVSKIAGVFYVELLQRAFPNRVSLLPPGSLFGDYLTLSIEEFIPGPTVGQTADPSDGRIPEENIAATVEMLMDVFLTHNKGKTGHYVGASDFHAHNVVLDPRKNNEAVLIDVGAEVIYRTISDYLLVVLRYYGTLNNNEMGRFLDVLYEQDMTGKLPPGRHWDEILEKTRNMARVLAEENIDYAASSDPDIDYAGNKFVWNQLKRIESLLDKYLQERTQAGQTSALVSQKDALGGIDFNERNMNITTKGKGADFYLPTLGTQGELIDLPGLVPVILQILPALDVMGLLGFTAEEQALLDQLSRRQEPIDDAKDPLGDTDISRIACQALPLAGHL